MFIIANFVFASTVLHIMRRRQSYNQCEILQYASFNWVSRCYCKCAIRLKTKYLVLTMVIFMFTQKVISWN